MGGDAVERLMEIVLQMKINMAHINETLQLQTTEIRQQLSVIFDDQRKSLEGHLGAIDAKLKDCSFQVADYQRLYASLAAMRQNSISSASRPAHCRLLWPVTLLKASSPGAWTS